MVRLGLLFPGEMGAAVGAAANAEVLWASAGRGEATSSRAAAAGFRDVGTLAELVRESEIVLSLCPPRIAESLAGEVAAAGFGGLYVEANAVAPARVERISTALAGGGARVIDGAVLGGGGLNLYLSGEEGEVSRGAALFDGSEVTVTRLEGGLGAASALKMAFGGWNKIGIALEAQAYAIARAYGVEEALAAEGVRADRVPRAGARAWRWAPEMEEVAETCAGLGLPDGLGVGAAALFERWSARRDRIAGLSELLDDLSG